MFESSCNSWNSLKTRSFVFQVWELVFSPKTQRITHVVAKNPIERVHSQGRVLSDRSVLYKYINPNLVAVVTQGVGGAHKSKSTLPTLYEYENNRPQLILLQNITFRYTQFVSPRCSVGINDFFNGAQTHQRTRTYRPFRKLDSLQLFQ